MPVVASGCWVLESHLRLCAVEVAGGLAFLFSSRIILLIAWFLWSCERAHELLAVLN
jgi:hypothetical protein